MVVPGTQLHPVHSRAAELQTVTKLSLKLGETGRNQKNSGEVRTLCRLAAAKRVLLDVIDLQAVPSSMT
jgi:hypothetical protein